MMKWCFFKLQSTQEILWMSFTLKPEFPDLKAIQRQESQKEQSIKPSIFLSQVASKKQKKKNQIYRAFMESFRGV